MNFFIRNRVLIGVISLLLAVIVTVAFCFFALSRTAAKAQRLTVVLDAGHGGVDGGVVGVNSGTKESDINLKITLLLQERFEEAGFNVILTRKTEAGLYGAAPNGYKKRDMQKRSEIINANVPSLVISVHQNFFSAKSRRGAQVFFRAESPQSIALAHSIQGKLNAMPECVTPNLQALVGDYYILNCNPFPAVIVECGFLSNAEDEALLLSTEYQKKLVESIVLGSIEFLTSSASN